MFIVTIFSEPWVLTMKISPLRYSSTRPHSQDIVVTEGELDAASGDDPLLIAPYHAHNHDDEIFYVLSGKIGFAINDEEIIATAGDAVVVPPGAVHTWWNASDAAARYLIVMTKRIADLIQAIHSGEYSPEQMTQLYEDHDSTLIGWSR